MQLALYKQLQVATFQLPEYCFRHVGIGEPRHQRFGSLSWSPIFPEAEKVYEQEGELREMVISLLTRYAPKSDAETQP